MSMQLTFLGATKTVTGSKYLITINNKKILVDCGLFQGFKELRNRNRDKFPIDPKTIDCVLITHAHIDHTGYLPLLVKNGFAGKIYCTPATYELCKILLPDSGFLQEEEAHFANKHGYSRHNPALPLYTREDAEKTLPLFRTIEFEQLLELNNDIKVTFKPAGHILGASIILFEYQQTRLLFSGDLGRMHDVLMSSPTNIQQADYLVVESTYGNRLHEHDDPSEQLERIINRTVKRGGKIVIPAFAVGRAQLMLYLIYQLKQAGKIADIPVFLDSPMAISATGLLCKYNEQHKINQNECHHVCNIANYINTADESKALNDVEGPMIIISASGMVEGGRVLHHIKLLAPDMRNTILLTGYQAAGTRGEAIAHGKDHLKIHGEIIPVKADVVNLTNISAHADYNEILEWLSHFTKAPRKVFITHGEEESAQSLKKKIQEKFGWHCVIPDYLQVERLV